MHILNCRHNRSYTSVASAEMEEKKKWPRWKKITVITAITLFVIAFIIFLLIWVIFPIVFMCSISIQRFFMFFPIQNPKNPEFNNPEKYNITGVVNFYIITTDLDDRTLTSIGAWMISHADEINTNVTTHGNETAVEVLRKSQKPVLFSLHGVACNRIKAVEIYKKIREHFLIIAVDHRGYGDSGPNVEMSEEGIVSDSVQIYQWIRRVTKNEIFVWGHSLGGALTLHTVRKLKEQNIVPMGVIIESSFTTMREEVESTRTAKLFKWLAYFEACFLDPLERNGFRFHSTTNILFVDSPLLMMHAEDDGVIPYRLGVRLAEVAKTERDLSVQGNVTFHLFPAILGYNHNDITSDLEMSNILENFIASSKEQNKMKG